MNCVRSYYDGREWHHCQFHRDDLHCFWLDGDRYVRFDDKGMHMGLGCRTDNPTFSGAPGEYAKECGFNPGMTNPPKPGAYAETWTERENKVKAIMDADEATHYLMWRALVLQYSHWPRSLSELDRMERQLKNKETK